MKTEEDEAFEEIERRQGGGFPAKRAMAADKLHWSDCAVHNAPAYPAGPCDCGVEKGQEEDWGALAEKQLASIKRDTQASFEDAMIRATHKVMAEFEAQPAQEPPSEWAGIKAILDEYGLQAIDFVADFKAALARSPQQEAIYGMNQDDWKDVVAAITKARDGRGIYLGCRPADVFQEWFLALGTAKLKEKNG